jgi:AAA family ATP:ADP antiporter
MLAKQANVLVALVAAVAAGLLARHVRREAYLLSFCLTMAALLLALIPYLEEPNVASIWLFYLYGDLFVTALVASLFSLLADSFDPLGARSAYAFVGLGGVLGGFAGSAAAGTMPALAQPAGAGFAALTLTLAIAIGGLVTGFLLRNRPLLSFRNTLRRTGSGGVKAAIGLLVRSPYLRLILALVMMYEMVSVCMDYQFTTTVTQQLPHSGYRAHFASVFAFTNFVAVAVQLLITGWILQRWGAGPALLLMPIVAIGGSLAFLASPVLLWASLLNTADNAMAYSVQQTAKEFMYVPTAREEKYEAKGFIDVLGLRFAKGLAILIGASISLLLGGDSVRWISLFVIVLLSVWLFAAWRLWGLHSSMLLSLSARRSS